MPAAFSRTTRSLQADSPRLSLAVWVAALMALAAWAAWFTLGSVSVIEISSKSRVEAQAAPHALMGDLAGKVLETRLRIGQAVQAGEVLVVLDSSRLEAQRAEESVRLQSIGPRLETLRREITTLSQAQEAEQRAAAAGVEAAMRRIREVSAGARFAQTYESRVSAEHEAGGVSEVDALRARSDAKRQQLATQALLADARRLSLDAQTRSHQAQAQIDALQRQVAGLEGEAAAAQAALARLDQDIQRHRLRSPVSGVIGEVAPLSPGTFVPEGQKLATIVPSGDLVVVADFDPAKALGRIQPGQPAHVRLDGFPWAQYGTVDARVLRVAREIRDQQLRVELQIMPPATPRPAQPPALQHGLTGSVEVEVERTSPAILVLRAAGQLAAPARPRTNGGNPALTP